MPPQEPAERPEAEKEYDGTPEAPAAYRWSYADQLKREKEEEKKAGKKGVFVYAVTVSVLFILCFGLLIGLLIFGAVNGFGGEIRKEYIDRIVYVREDKEDPGLLSVQEIADRVIPSTVGVSVQKSAGTSTGTGIVLDTEGYIATNYHVIKDQLSIRVIMADSTEFPAELVGGDEFSDLAVVKINPGSYELKPAVFGDSSKLLVGDTVVAIGNAGGLDLFGTVTRGVISGVNRDIKFYDANNLIEKRMTLIQTDAMINPGNSGGPLVDMYGCVIGINFMKYVNDEFEGLGFAIPSNGAQIIIDEIIRTGSYSGDAVAKKGVSLGISAVEVTRNQLVVIEDGKEYVSPGDGICVASVTDENSSAYGYLQMYDLITSIDGKPVATVEQIRAILEKCSVGDVIEVTLLRDGKTLTVSIPLK